MNVITSHPKRDASILVLVFLGMNSAAAWLHSMGRNGWVLPLVITSTLALGFQIPANSGNPTSRVLRWRPIALSVVFLVSQVLFLTSVHRGGTGSGPGWAWFRPLVSVLFAGATLMLCAECWIGIRNCPNDALTKALQDKV